MTLRLGLGTVPPSIARTKTMATAVLDLDLARLPPGITGLEAYDRAFILIRLHGRPVGQAVLPLRSGGISGVELRQELSTAAGLPLWEQWLQEFLSWEEPD